ncbi:MAG: DUF5010 domain-containing protein [Planctomycetota bacterium]|jgi:hypothetical protein
MAQAFQSKGSKNKSLDLTNKQGREWFYVTVRDFFSLIPPEKWARIDGKPIVFLFFAKLAAAVDETVLDDLRKRFKSDFNTDLYIVKHSDWPGKTEAWYQWGGSFGLTIGDRVACLGPGFDDIAVPGKKRVFVDRLQGKFYKEQWEKLLSMDPQRRPWIVQVETWNEWHQGREVARSREYGDQYIKATAKYSRMFRKGIRLDLPGKFTNARQVRWSAKESNGLTLRPGWPDGYWEHCTVDNTPAVVTVANKEGSTPDRHLYFDIDDSYLFNATNITVELTVVFRDDGQCERFRIEYDNNDPAVGKMGGALRPMQDIKVGDTETWRSVKLQLPNVRFCNRIHHADFRLAVEGGAQRLTVREVIVRKLPN